MTLQTERIFVLCFLVSCCHCDPFNLTEVLDDVLTSLDITSNETSQSCSYQLNELRATLEEQGSQLWGLKMLDASSRIQSGILSPSTGELGNFEECINTKGILSDGREVVGKYCLGELHFDSLHHLTPKELYNRTQDQTTVQKIASSINNMAVVENTGVLIGPTWAGCFPDGCSTADVNLIVNRFVHTFLDKNISINFHDAYCQTDKDVNSGLSPNALFIRNVLILYFIILLIFTLIDMGLRNTKAYPKSRAISIYSNIAKVFWITNDSDYMPCLDGMKVLSMMWVLLGHQYSTTCSGPITNASGVIQWADSFHSMFIVSSTLSVDTFLVISAFLLSIRYLKASETKRPSLRRLLVRRFIRVSPALAAMVAVNKNLLMDLGSGPKWPSVKLYFQDNCENYWWSTLLFMQNYLNRENMCVTQSWFLSINMHLYIISLPLLLLLHKCNKVVSCAIGLSAAGYTYLAWAVKLKALISNPHEDVRKYHYTYLFFTHLNATPWLIGILCGNVLFLHEKGRISAIILRYIKFWTPLIWSVWLGAVLLCVFAGYRTLRQPTHSAGDGFHITIARPVWALVICWVIFVCLADIGKPARKIRQILGHPLFQILRRLVYSVYLVHVTVMHFISFTRKSPVHFSNFDMMQEFSISMVFSWSLAFVWVLAFEYPFINLEKALRRDRAQEEPPPYEEPPVPYWFEQPGRQEGTEMGPVHLNIEEPPMLHPSREENVEAFQENRAPQEPTGGEESGQSDSSIIRRQKVIVMDPRHLIEKETSMLHSGSGKSVKTFKKNTVPQKPTRDEESLVASGSRQSDSSMISRQEYGWNAMVPIHLIGKETSMLYPSSEENVEAFEESRSPQKPTRDKKSSVASGSGQSDSSIISHPEEIVPIHLSQEETSMLHSKSKKSVTFKKKTVPRKPTADEELPVASGSGQSDLAASRQEEIEKRTAQLNKQKETTMGSSIRRRKRKSGKRNSASN